jgi:UDP:flavonoid glycosyltransferase YjiC (YdhE family)
MRIDFIAPPYAGHLFPLLQIARGLQQRGYRRLRVISTIEAAATVQIDGLEFMPILEGVSGKVFEISNTPHRVGSNPWRLWRQLQQNLSLLERLKQELTTLWTKQPADLLLCDFTVPVAGLLAQSMGISWWTTCPSPCAIETIDGVPSYLGGWQPRHDWFGRIRDGVGRQTIKTFKRAMHWLFRKQMKRLGVPQIYRADGSEWIYSPDKILALGVREFEFPCRWPQAMSFVGPAAASPALDHQPPQFQVGRKHVLVSLGTHLWWAKTRAVELLIQVARELPEFEFHFTFGRGIAGELLPQLQVAKELPPNLKLFEYLPYAAYIHHYDLAWIHGGTGVMYQCLAAGIPLLSWPQDFDQFDHTARITYHGLGIRCQPKVEQIVKDLRRLDQEPMYRERCEQLAEKIKGYDLIDWVVQQLMT